MIECKGFFNPIIKRIKGFPGYYISDMGGVFSEWDYEGNQYSSKKRIKGKNLKKMALCKSHNGYLLVGLQVKLGGKRVTKRVGRLVAQAFLLKPLKGQTQVNHINGIKTDDRAINLEWCTPSENQLHALKWGFRKPPKGSKVSNSKLTELQVKKIRELLTLKHNQYMIAKHFKVSQSLISMIKSNVIWTHI